MQGTTELREKLATACRLLFMEGLMDHAGLAGARIPETGNLLLNPREMRGTPGRHPGIMTAGDFVVVDPEGTKIEGENNPPSETPIFTGVFRARVDAMAVFHLHLPTATLFSIVGMPLRPVGVMGSPFGRAVPVCPDATLIQRREQGEAVARALGQNLAVLLQGHGAVIVGGSIEEAFVAAILLEDNARAPVPRERDRNAQSHEGRRAAPSPKAGVAAEGDLEDMALLPYEGPVHRNPRGIAELSSRTILPA
jgi:ribulose-5-phosphate 4-epimerase/fuculose-1-phosphate aldolase